MIKITEEIVEQTYIPIGFYMTVKEVAGMMNMNESTIRTKIARGEIPSYFTNGKRLIPVEFMPEFRIKS